VSDAGWPAARPAHSSIGVIRAMVVTVVAWTVVAACDRPAGQPADGAPLSPGAPVAATVVTASPARAVAPPRLAATAQASPPPAEPLVALVTADAAHLTGVGLDAVRIVLVEPREWPDRSLGCPRPGMGYAQAITPGYLIVAEAGGRQLEYHSDHAQIVLCTPA